MFINIETLESNKKKILGVINIDNFIQCVISGGLA